MLTDRFDLARIDVGTRLLAVLAVRGWSARAVAARLMFAVLLIETVVFVPAGAVDAPVGVVFVALVGLAVAAQFQLTVPAGQPSASWAEPADRVAVAAVAVLLAVEVGAALAGSPMRAGLFTVAYATQVACWAAASSIAMAQHDIVRTYRLATPVR